MNQNEAMQDSDELDALWQQQETISVDTSKIVKQAKSQRTKQRLYALIDFSSILVVWGILFLDLSLSNFVKGFIILNASITTILVIFLIKLRWVSIFYTNSNTADYQARLLKQLGNNARIAFYNKHSTWFSGMMVTLFLIVQSYTADLSQSALIKQFTLLALICVFFLLPYYLWARKRQQRFEKELASLHTLTNNVQDKPA